jgi:hypothetical protein
MASIIAESEFMKIADKNMHKAMPIAETVIIMAFLFLSFSN